jgi:acetyl esterase
VSRHLAVAAALWLAALPAAAQPKARPKPELADVKYGPHERNVLDLWKAKSDTPAPLVVFIHGGGFHAGGKEAVPPPLVRGLRAAGVSVMSVNYRLSPGVAFPAHYTDYARAIPFARSRAGDWNLDPKRVAAVGGSAGAGTSLWIGFHADLADPKTWPTRRATTRSSGSPPGWRAWPSWGPRPATTRGSSRRGSVRQRPRTRR